MLLRNIGECAFEINKGMPHICKILSMQLLGASHTLSFVNASLTKAQSKWVRRQCGFRRKD